MHNPFNEIFCAARKLRASDNSLLAPAASDTLPSMPGGTSDSLPTDIIR